ncbi:MAG TPA: methyltransferase domain-containing protein [Planctomycetaceae bacterium]|nr:methyltransferase domain-containing protein [Planctomycetaceae bacterium]
MSTTLTTLNTRNLGPLDGACDGQAVEKAVLSSYDGSNVVSRLLRMETWGPALMNLGYFPFRGPLAALNVVVNLEGAQRQLVFKSVTLLDVQSRHRVLDLACGRGKSSFIIHCLQPAATVVGVDLLDRNIQVAQALFDHAQNLSYQTGDAADLDFPDGSFDRLLCLEAAFHFPDRAQFLLEAWRVLRPGGRMVVVDFAWKTEAHRAHRNDPETRIVRDIWQWEDFFSIADYERESAAAGFRLISSSDWSSRVSNPIQQVFRCLSRLGNTRAGRQLLEWRNPLYRSISTEDWRSLATAVRAHQHVRSVSSYMAFVLEKPDPLSFR